MSEIIIAMFFIFSGYCIGSTFFNILHKNDLPINSSKSAIRIKHESGHIRFIGPGQPIEISKHEWIDFAQRDIFNF